MKFRLTLRQIFSLSLVFLTLGLLGLLVLLFAGFETAMLKSSEVIREIAGRETARRVTEYLSGAPALLAGFEKACEDGVINPANPESVRAGLQTLLLENPNISEAGFTTAKGTGYNDDGDLLIEPGSVRQTVVAASGKPGEYVGLETEWNGQMYVSNSVALSTAHASPSPWLPAPNPSEHPTFQTPAKNSFQGKLLWTDLHWTQLDEALPTQQRRVELSVLKAIYSAKGNFLGVLRVGLLKAQIDAAVRLPFTDPGQPDPHRVFLCDNQGRLITAGGAREETAEFGDDLRIRTQDVPEVIRIALSQPGLADVTDAHPTATAFKQGSETWLATFRTLPGTQDWIVGVVVPRDFYLAPLVKIRTQVATLTIALIVLMLVPGWWVLQRVGKGLARLAEAMNRFDLDDPQPERVDIRSNDEVGMLAESFNQMSTKLHTSTHALVEKTEALNHAFTLTSTIMSTVQEGLFLITVEGRIEPNYSTALENILARKNLEGTRFLDAIRERITSKDYELTERFLKLLFNPAKANHTIPRLNPLKEAEFAFQQVEGQLLSKHLTFTFERVWNGNDIPKALVTVQDVSARVNLLREIKESSEKLSRQAQMLFGVIHVRPAILQEFIQDTREHLARVDQQLRVATDPNLGAAQQDSYFRDKLSAMQREVHRIKGNAAVLKIGYYENAAHQLEEKIALVQCKSTLDGNDFVPLVLELSEMTQRLSDIEDVVRRISATYGSEESAAMAKPKTSLSVRESLVQLIESVGGRLGKKARLVWEAPAIEHLRPGPERQVREILVQLVRNSLAHGIELPEPRRIAGKAEIGSIRIKSWEENGWTRLLLQDDGAGLNYEAIIRRAQDMDATKPGLLASLIDYEKGEWKIEALNNFILTSGFSTSSEVSLDSGRGVGLDVVQQEAEGMNGSVQVLSAPEHPCQFVINLPPEHFIQN